MVGSFEFSSGSGESVASNLGGHCYEHKCKYCSCLGIVLLVIIIIVSVSWDVIEPTEFGLLQNTITREVDLENVYGNGRYFVGPTAQFIAFPSNMRTLSYGERSCRGSNVTKDCTPDNTRSIAARSGGESKGGQEGGGQPLSLSVSFQYRFTEEWIAGVYTAFGMHWETTYLRFAQQAITNVAQNYMPRQFWTDRALIEKAMLEAVNSTLVRQGFAMCMSLQLRAIGFQSSYEQTITNIQLQEQLKTTKSYQLEVTRVLKNVDVRQSTTDAEVAVINAEARRQKAIIEGQAKADALQREQSAKAEMYHKLAEHLSWSTNEFLQYIKMKALNGQAAQGNVIVGVNPLGTEPMRST